MTSKEALDILSQNNPASIIIGRIIGKQKYIEALHTIKQDLEVLKILKHYAVNDGWSNGWVIHFWEMNSKELKKVEKVFRND